MHNINEWLYWIRSIYLKEAAVEATTVGSYLIIARYNRGSWTNLESAVGLVLGEEKPSAHEAAHKSAEALFPYKPEKKAPAGEGKYDSAAKEVLSAGQEEETELEEQPLPYPLGTLFVQTFHSKIHADVAKRTSHMSNKEWKEKGESILDAIFDEFEYSSNKVPGINVNVRDPGVGWIAIVHPDSLEEFVRKMGGQDSPLWRMYDIRIIPLNNDQTTDDIYKYMTPSNWKT